MTFEKKMAGRRRNIDDIDEIIAYITNNNDECDNNMGMNDADDTSGSYWEYEEEPNAMFMDENALEIACNTEESADTDQEIVDTPTENELYNNVPDAESNQNYNNEQVQDTVDNGASNDDNVPLANNNMVPRAQGRARPGLRVRGGCGRNRGGKRRGRGVRVLGGANRGKAGERRGRGRGRGRRAAH